MKAIRVSIVFVMIGFVVGSPLFGIQSRRAGAGAATVATPPKPVPVRRGAAPVKPAPAPAAPHRAARPLVGKPAPAVVDTIVWNKLSDEQQEEFKVLSSTFQSYVNLLAQSKEYTLWFDTVIEQAKEIININSLLAGYCIEVISNELKRSGEAKDLDVGNEITAVTQMLKVYAKEVAQQVSQRIQEEKMRIPEHVFQGTDKEQFDKLMQFIPVTQNKQLTPAWIKAVHERAKKLVLDGMMQLKDVKEALVGAFAKAFGQEFTEGSLYMKTIDFMVNTIFEDVANIGLVNSPEYINQNFQSLLLNVGSATNWDNFTRLPNRAWQNQIVVAAKKMMQVFNVPLNDIEQQIGAQVYFVAVMKKGGQALSDQEANSLISLVTTIKNLIAV